MMNKASLGIAAAAHFTFTLVGVCHECEHAFALHQLHDKFSSFRAPIEPSHRSGILGQSPLLDDVDAQWG
jgi:hypothetical protein